MTKLKGLMFGLIAALLMTLAACDSVSTTTPENEPALTTQAPGRAFWNSCPEFLSNFAGEDGTHNGVTYKLDDQGRPEFAYGRLNQNRPRSQRQEYCQTDRVGNLWKNKRQRSPNTAGGHLFAIRLGGWGGRVNMAPQDAKFNNSNWKSIENRAAKCRWNDNIQMNVFISYPNNNTAVPDSWGVRFDKGSTAGSDFKIAVFGNGNNGRGGDAGDNPWQLRNEVVNWLKKQGCK